MRHRNRWIVVFLIIAGLQLAACAQKPATVSKIEPAKLEEIEGSEFKRVVLTEKAAERIGTETAMVREEQVVQKQTVVGEVVAKRGGAAANPNQLWVRAPFNETDIKLVARDQHVQILPLAGDDEDDPDEEEYGWSAELDEGLGLDDDEDSDVTDTALYYVVDSTKTGLVLEQRVFVEVALSGSRTLRKVIPYASLIYDVNGGTWVYIKEPNALSFIRQSVTVDYIQGDLAFLTEGPPVGTEVVTVGVAELYGAETGVSK